ncbi:hypothetical protein BC829DRAFT_397613 [Chytridium lagenaria]|nr:hypothetical protein BC829DRAFT_397613 [Chytridium lagenaria]
MTWTLELLLIIPHLSTYPTFPQHHQFTIHFLHDSSHIKPPFPQPLNLALVPVKTHIPFLTSANRSNTLSQPTRPSSPFPSQILVLIVFFKKSNPGQPKSQPQNVHE